MAYCSHDNLVEKGSTGQKQLININQVLTQKQTARIFLFDEADNALDQENKKVFREKINRISKKKIIILISH